MGWRNSSWLFIDTETTGLKVKDGARVWELGWVLVDNLKIKESGNWMINPGVEIPQVIQNLTGLDPRDLEGKPSFSDIAHEFSNKVNSVDFMMAYNAKFDKDMVENEMNLAGTPLPNKQWLDPMIWIQRFIKLGNHKLATVAQHFEVSLENAHRADEDAKASVEIVLKFIKTYEGQVIPDDPLELADLQKAWDADNRSLRFSKKHPTSNIKFNK